MHGASSPHFKLSWPVFPASAVRKLDFYNPVTSFAYSTLFFLVDLFHLFAHAFWSEHFNTPCRCLYQIWLWGFLLRFLCVFFSNHYFNKMGSVCLKFSWFLQFISYDCHFLLMQHCLECEDCMFLASWNQVKLPWAEAVPYRNLGCFVIDPGQF